MVCGRILGDRTVMHRWLARPLAFLQRVAGPRYPILRLIDCERCASRCVNPVSWEERGQTHWWIRLRCGECGFVREVEVTDMEAQRLDRDLERGVADIAATIDRLERARMRAAADALTVALQRDLIDPSDFIRR
jgi:hypothetical protein